MDSASLLVELYGRVPHLANDAIAGLSKEELVAQLGPAANTVAWLVWHAARVQDHHVAEILDTDQVWVSGTIAERFGLEPDPSNTGYGHSPSDVRAVTPVEPRDLTDYLDAVQVRSMAWLPGLSDADLDQVVDRRWDPPVTMGVRLVSIADDSLQHLGQAAYVRGLLGH